jgi:hypothetical protein
VKGNPNDPTNAAAPTVRDRIRQLLCNANPVTGAARAAEWLQLLEARVAFAERRRVVRLRH